MKRSLIVFLDAVLAACFAANVACAQCPNGVCSLSRFKPVEARVFEQQDMGPLEKKIVQIEKDALEKWYSGDPSAYIAMMGNDIGYFEPSLEKRLDGREPLSKMYEALRGKVHAEKFDMLNTRVQATDSMAVLSFNIISIESGVPFRWNCTEVFSLDGRKQWKLIHSHWSQTRPMQQ